MSGRLLYLGVDGGGTKTEFICIDDADEIVARAVTGTTYHLQVGLDGAALQLTSGIQEICRTLSISTADLAFTFFGLPAYGEDSIIDPQLHAACAKILGHDRYLCGNDMVCGWAGSLGCEDGINLVAGTGTIGYGERQGRGARVGGWGEIFSDEGSAYWIAIQGLNAFTRMSDGRAPKGPLYEIVRERLKLGADLDLCARIMGERGMGRDEIASLAPMVAAAADAGDAASTSILLQAAAELLDMAVALRKELGFADGDRVSLSWSGGILVNQAAVRDALAAALQAAGGFEIIEPRYSPGHGAAMYAKRCS